MDHNYSGILVYLQQSGGGIFSGSMELLAKAIELTQENPEAEVYAVTAGPLSEEDLAKQLAGYGIRRLILYATPADGASLHALSTDLVYDAICQCRPAVVLISATIEGRILAPALGIRCGTGVTADCTGLRLEPGQRLIQTRPAFGGNVLADIATEHSRPQIATVRPGIFDPAAPHSGSEAIPYECTLLTPTSIADSNQKSEHTLLTAADNADNTQEPAPTPGSANYNTHYTVLSHHPRHPGISIESADRIVAIGAGVRSREDIQLFEDFAAQIGAVLACSRKITEKGWLTPDRQIGLSGRSVAPKLLILCGISGSVQFLAGIRRASNIIAINKDPDAPIRAAADLFVEGDVYEFLPALSRLLRQE